MVSLNPNVLMAVGKKFLKPFAPRWQCCMTMKSQTFGSFAASMIPPMLVVAPLLPTVSFWVRSWASCRSSGVSHFVVRGSSGKTKNAARATRSVAAPWMMKSHCHPAIPAWISHKQFSCSLEELLTNPCILKIPRAIKPANAVARMFPVYKIEMRTANSLRV